MATSLTIDLFGPGMGPLHRAGLGGLAATIDKVKHHFAPGQLDYDDRTVTLSWEKPERIRDFFRKLYGLAFGLDDQGLIHLPGSYGDLEPRRDVKAALQQAMSLTILQFGPNRKALSVPRVRVFEVDEQPIVIEHQHLLDYTHCSAWEDLITTRGQLKDSVRVGGTIAPGFVQRHVVFSETYVEFPPGAAISLHFALVGTTSLVIDYKTAVLVVPDVENLRTFARLRGSSRPVLRKNAGSPIQTDAALQMQVRLLGAKVGSRTGLRRCLAILFAAQTWNEKQKTRAAILEIDRDVLDLGRNRAELARFEAAMLELPPRVAPPRIGDKKRPVLESHWVASAVRPLVAANLANKRPWYQDFRSLVVGPDGSTDEQKVRQLNFDKKGLQAMIDQDWDDPRENTLIQAIHGAMYRASASFGMIRNRTRRLSEADERTSWTSGDSRLHMPRRWMTCVMRSRIY